MAEPERKCATCKFYEPAPIWRKGWCRNPLLYAPQQSHLVAEDDLDCSRGLSDYWEAADGTGPNAGVNVAAASGGRDFFGRGAVGSGGTDAGTARTTDNPWDTGGYGGAASYGSGSSGYNSGYSGIGRAVPPVEDDSYAPQESSGGPSAQPRYLGSVGDDDDPSDVRNPWDNSQRGFAAPPIAPSDSGNYGRSGYETTEAVPHSGYGNDRGYGDPQSYGNDPGYGQADAAGYGASDYGHPDAADNGYGQGDYNPNGYGQGGYGAESGQGAYGSGYGGYGQGQEYGQDGGYGQPYGADQGGYDAGYGQGGYGQNGGYDPGYGGPTSPPPAVSGTRAPAAGAAGARRVTAAPQGRERALTYYTEERYWTDYAKLVVPVVVVIALLAAIWFIGTGKIGRGNSATSTPNATTVAAMAGTTPAGARPTGPAAGGSVVAGTMRPPGTPGAPGTTSGTMAPTLLPSVVVPPPNAGAMASPAAAGTMTAGGATSTQFKVANTGGTGVNMRSEPNTTSAKITVVPEGSIVQQIGDPMQGEGGTWYKVQFGMYSGWIRNDFLAPA